MPATENNVVTMNIKKVSPDGSIPTRGSADSAGYDLYSIERCSIAPHDTHMIHTGIAVEIPTGFFGGIFARSGLASKKGLRPANCVGVIDPDYRGEIMVALHNDMDEAQEVDNGMRIAQLVLIPFVPIIFNEVDKLSDTDRSVGGFGSTGR